MERNQPYCARFLADSKLKPRSAMNCDAQLPSTRGSSRLSAGYGPDSCQFGALFWLEVGEDFGGVTGWWCGCCHVMAADVDGDVAQGPQGLDDATDAHAGAFLQVAGHG